MSGERRLRIFLGAFGDPGHAFPMLALGARLAARGHDVTLETWQRWREHVEAEGMRFVSAPEYPVFPTREQPLKPYEAVVVATAETREAMAAASPDVVVHDILTLAPAMAAELEGVPVGDPDPARSPMELPTARPRTRSVRAIRGRRWAARCGGRCPIRWRRDYAGAGASSTRLGRGSGLPPVTRLFGGISDRLCLVGTFPQLEYPRAWPAHVKIVGPLIWEPPFGDVESPPGDRPLVLIAPSTAQDPEHRLLRAALLGLAGEPVRVLAATNRRPLARSADVPANARLVEWLSYSRTMPQASLVISHAGHGTVARALESGCPVLAVPHSGDMGENAARIDWAGVGARLPWRFLSPATLRLAVRRVLDEPMLAERARGLSAWAATHDGASTAAELVERLAGVRAGG